jgi:hypothetical protein
MAALFNFPAFHQMHVKTKRRTLPDFEARSVALFSALLVGAVLAAPGRAQTTAPSLPSVTRSVPSMPVTTRTTPTVPPAASRTSEITPRLTVAQVQQAFQTIDANRDGALSRAEVSAFPRIERHFERLDANRDGTVSPAEFEQALQQPAS